MLGEMSPLVWIWGLGALAMALAVVFLRRRDADDLEDDDPAASAPPADPEMEAWADEVEAMEFDDTVDEANDAGDVCPHCLAPIEQFDHFCPKCQGPITAHASIDPIGQIHATGRAYRQAAGSDAAPGKATLIAIWLIFGPQLLALIALLGAMAISFGNEVVSYDVPRPAGIEPIAMPKPSASEILTNIAGCLIVAGIATVYAMILIKTTKRYMHAPARDQRDNADNDSALR